MTLQLRKKKQTNHEKGGKMRINKKQADFILKSIKKANKKYRNDTTTTGFTEEVNDKIFTMLQEVSNDLYEIYRKDYVTDIINICGEGIMELNPKVMMLHCLVNVFDTIQKDFVDRIYHDDKTLNILASETKMTDAQNTYSKDFIKKEMIHYLMGQDNDVDFLKYFEIGDKRKLN